MKNVISVVVACVVLVVACCASAGEVVKTVTVEKACVAGVCHPVINAAVHPVATVSKAVGCVRERVCERRACRAARRCVCQVACEVKTDKALSKVPEVAQKGEVVRQRTVVRSWFRGGCAGGSCAR